MFKFLKSWIFGGEIPTRKQSNLNSMQKSAMSYSKDKTGAAWHDKQLARIQWLKGFITDDKYDNLKYSNKRLFDLNTLSELYPNCTEDQLKWLKNTGFDLINMESHHKCIQAYEITDNNVFFKYVTFTTSPNVVRLGFDKYKPIFLYNKTVGNEVKSIYIVPIIYECNMSIIEYNKYSNSVTSTTILSEDEKLKLNECILNLRENSEFYTFNINKDFYELNYSTLDVNKKLPLSKFDFTIIEEEDLIPVKFPEE